MAMFQVEVLQQEDFSEDMKNMISRSDFRLINAIAAVMFLVVSATGAHAAEIKIGSVNMQTIINESDMGIDAIKEMKAKIEKENKILKGKQTAYKKLEQDLEQQRMMSRPEVLEEKEQELLRMKREVELYKQDTRRSIQRHQARVTSDIVKKVKAVVKGYAKANGYSLILEGSEGPAKMGGFIVYASKEVDLTNTITKLFNKKYKAGELDKKQ